MAKSKEGYVYQGARRKVEDVMRRSKQAGSTFDGYLDSNVPMFKAKEGDVEVRILPPTWDVTGPWGDGWHIEIYLHYNVGMDDATYLCRNKMKGEPCPVCEARNAAVDEEEAAALKPSWRALAWVIDRHNEKAGPQVWSMPATLFREINGRSVDKKTEEVIPIDHPEQGYDVLFTREGSKLRTKYGAVEITRDPCPIHDDERLQQRWMDYIVANPLPDVLQFYDEEHIERVLTGKSSRRRDDDEEETETRSPRGSRRGVAEEAEEPRRSRRAAVEEEEEAPRSSRRRATDEEQLEEDEAPSSRRLRRAAEPEAEEEEEPISRRATRAASRGRDRGDESEEAEEAPRSRRLRAAPAEPEEEEEAPLSRRPRRAAAEPEDEEEEAPRARGSRRAVTEPEEEEEEVPAPSRRARGALDRARARA